MRFRSKEKRKAWSLNAVAAKARLRIERGNAAQQTNDESFLRPSECKTITDVCALDRSHISSGRWDMLVQHDGALVFTEQRPFEQPTASITIPREVFQKMLEWYETDQP